MRVTLIHNPGAGRHAKDDLERLQEMIRAAGHELRCQSCKHDGWAKALDEPADLVAVAGGDGQFDLVMASESERGRLLHYLEIWQDEKERLAVLPSRQGKVLRLEWTGFPVHIDDEFWPGDEKAPAAGGLIEVRLEGAAVEILAPTRG